MSASVAPALADALALLADRVPVERIDRVWVFPPRPLGAGESHLVVLSLLDAHEPETRREILTLHSVTTPEKDQMRRQDALVEQGSAPVDRVERLIQGVLLRLKDEREIPRSETVASDPARWAALLGYEPPAP